MADDLAVRGVKLLMLSFTKGKDQLSMKEVEDFLECEFMLNGLSEN